MMNKDDTYRALQLKLKARIKEAAHEVRSTRGSITDSLNRLTADIDKILADHREAIVVSEDL